MSDKGGQQVGPSVGPIARLKQENRDLERRLHRGVTNERALLKKVESMELEMGRRHRVDTDTIEGLNKEVDRLRIELGFYRDNDYAAKAEYLHAMEPHYKELQEAAEAVEGPARHFPLSIRPKIRALHKAIRKVRGMG